MQVLTSLDGTPLSVGQLLDRLQVDGALTALQSGFSTAQAAAWRDDVLAGAAQRGMRPSIDGFNGVILIADAAHEERFPAVCSLPSLLCESSGSELTSVSRSNHPSRRSHLRLIVGGANDT